MRSRFLTLCVYALFVVCPLLFFTDLTRNPYYTQIALLNILICLCWVFWLWQAWRAGEWVWVSSPLDKVLWALMAVCLLSWMNSFFWHPNFHSPIYSEGSRAYIFLIVNSYLTYAAAVRFQDREQLKKLLWMTYAVTVAASVYGVAQYFGTEWFWPHNLNPYGSRPVSSFGNPNFLSSYLVMILPVALADYAYKVTGFPRVLLGGVVLSALAALLATLTRSSWGGAAVACVGVGIAILLQKEGWQKIRVPVLALGTLMILLVAFWPKSPSAAYSETVLGRVLEVKQAMHGKYGAVDQRQLIWLSGWEMVLDHPFLGTGWGCFELFYPYYQATLMVQEKYISFRTHANNAHDEILEHWTQIGTIGLGIVVFLWLIFFRTSASIARRLELPWKALEWGLAAGVAGMLADNLLNVSVHFAVPAFIFWWWVGSAFVLEPASLQIKRFPLQSGGRKLAVVVVALVLVCFAGRSAMMWAGEIYFFKGFKLSKAGVDLMTASRYLKTAYTYHPLEVNNNYELANVYARLDQKQNALEMYGRALDANSGYDEIYFNRATLLMQAGREEEAVHSYQRALAMNPLSREACNALSGIYFRNIPKYGDEAVAMYHRVLSAWPGDKDLWNNLGYLEVQRQHWPEAREAYSKAVEIDPTYDLARRNLAVVEQTLKKLLTAHK